MMRYSSSSPLSALFSGGASNICTSSQRSSTAAAGDPASGRAGTAFDPDGPEPDAQAEVDGACAYTYRRDTDGGTRTGRVIITWNLSWSSTINGAPGPSGLFDPAELPTEISRQVDEVQATVTEVNLAEASA